MTLGVIDLQREVLSDADLSQRVVRQGCDLLAAQPAGSPTKSGRQPHVLSLQRLPSGTQQIANWRWPIIRVSPGTASLARDQQDPRQIACLLWRPDVVDRARSSAQHLRYTPSVAWPSMSNDERQR
jgi:hypothetical protein